MQARSAFSPAFSPASSPAAHHLPSRRVALSNFNRHTTQPDPIDTTANMSSNLEQRIAAIACASAVLAFEIVYCLLRRKALSVQHPSAARMGERIRLRLIICCAVVLGAVGLSFLAVGIYRHHVGYLLGCKGVFVLSIWVFEVRQEPNIFTCTTDHLSSLRNFHFCD